MIVTKSDYRHTKSPVSYWNRLPFSLHIISVNSLLILGCIFTIHNLYNLFTNSPTILKPPLKYSLTHGGGQRELYILLAGSTQTQVKHVRASKITTNLNWGQRKEMPRPPRLMGNQFCSVGFKHPGAQCLYTGRALKVDSPRPLTSNKIWNLYAFAKSDMSAI